MVIGRVIDMFISIVMNIIIRIVGNMELWELNGLFEMVGNDFLKFLFVIIYVFLWN